ncbi:hypothetical protein [Mycobacterium botniense]|uniref:Secreted protein n=1 Tax=Mycobacterium botniense TaxID=84962 RepID=A0A7I9XXI3_9MYCO|nr:hypothetical protein [Mycobacterium botniense]GFG74511.1 hypothetical protein MBOT_18760 [Mycobacterium botniense]
MRVVGTIGCATLAAAAMVPGFGSLSAASPDSIALNGMYRATSDGQWAKTNYAYHNEATVTSVWTISSACTDPMDCSGRVTSDQGWSAPLRLVGGNMWFVTHDVENWEQCGDGMPPAPGHQTFKFSADENLSGWDYTVGPSGACGANKWLVVEMPFKLVKIG